MKHNDSINQSDDNIRPFKKNRLKFSITRKMGYTLTLRVITRSKSRYILKR